MTASAPRGWRGWDDAGGDARAKVLDRIVAACADGSLDPSELAARSEAAQQATTPSALNAVIPAGCLLRR